MPAQRACLVSSSSHEYKEAWLPGPVEEIVIARTELEYEQPFHQASRRIQCVGPTGVVIRLINSRTSE